jgi:DnaJ-class molecular chaperone
MEEKTELFDLPVGVKNGASIVFERQGHESRHNEIGDLVLNTRYVMPDGWSFDDSTGGLKKKVVIDFISLTTGFEYVAPLISGEKVKVYIYNRNFILFFKILINSINIFRLQ